MRLKAKTKSASDPTNVKASIAKRIVAEGLFIGICVVIFSIVALSLSGLAEGSAQELQQLKNEMMGKTAEIQSLQAKMTSFKNALPIWNGFKNKTEGYNFTLSRDEATSIMMELRDLYAFKDIQVTISPIRPSSDQALIRPNLRVMVSDININMRAYSDEQVVKFIDDIKQRLAGVVKVRTLKMNRTIPTASRSPSVAAEAEADPARLNDPQLSVSIILTWYGMEEIATNTNMPANGMPPGMVPPPMPPGAMR